MANIKKSFIVEKIFSYKGHECVCLFMSGGFRTGYVSIDPTSDYGVEDLRIRCHGGITYRGKLERVKQEYSLISEEFIGFDCIHCDDEIDWPTLKLCRDYYNLDSFAYTCAPRDSESVKTLDFVIEQCKNIVDQIEANNAEK